MSSKSHGDLKKYVPKLKKKISSETFEKIESERKKKSTFHLSIKKYCKNLPTSIISPVLSIKGKKCQLYITNCVGASDEKELKKIGVTHAVDLSETSKRVRGIEYMNITENIPDESNYPIVEKIGKRVVEFISDTLRKSDEHVVLVYCAMGISRSATTILQYLMHTGMSLKEGWTHLRSCRSFVNPNLGFWDQLSNLEMKMTGKRSMSTHDYVKSELLEFWPSIGPDFAEIVADRVLKIPFEDMITGTFLDAAVKSLQMSNDKERGK